MIYLDYNATTPIDESVGKAMLPYITQHFGNPSSNHALGQLAKAAVEKARNQVAALLNADPDEIYFTSGGSEANNTAIKGVSWHNQTQGRHIIASQIEHPAVLNVCAWLEKQGFSITYLPVDSTGLVNPSDLEAAISDETLLVSIMHANNETGTIQPVRELTEISHRYGAYFHTDAAQSAGKIPIDVKQLDVDFLTVAGHKLYAPKGIGALYIRRGIEIESLIHGAGHERGLRAGTENVIFDVALGQACETAGQSISDSTIEDLTNYLWNELQSRLGERVVLNGHPTRRLPNTLNISFIGLNGHELLARLPDVAASTGSACHSGETAASPVLHAMGLSSERGRGAVRFSLGRYTKKAEIDQVIKQIERVTKESYAK